MQDRLTRRTKLIYGCGDTGFSLTGTIIAAYFAIFLTDVVGISPGIAAIAIFVGRSWDYINDPLIGYLSDRTRTRWGRRRPFLLFGALPFALAFILMWYRPPIQNLVFLAIYYAFAYVLFDSAATFVYMPYFALTPELTSNYDERTSADHHPHVLLNPGQPDRLHHPAADYRFVPTRERRAGFVDGCDICGGERGAALDRFLGDARAPRVLKT